MIKTGSINSVPGQPYGCQFPLQVTNLTSCACLFSQNLYYPSLSVLSVFLLSVTERHDFFNRAEHVSSDNHSHLKKKKIIIFATFTGLKV